MKNCSFHPENVTEKYQKRRFRSSTIVSFPSPSTIVGAVVSKLLNLIWDISLILNHTLSNFLITVFHKFYLFYSWILFLAYMYSFFFILLSPFFDSWFVQTWINLVASLKLKPAIVNNITFLAFSSKELTHCLFLVVSISLQMAFWEISEGKPWMWNCSQISVHSHYSQFSSLLLCWILLIWN